MGMGFLAKRPVKDTNSLNANTYVNIALSSNGRTQDSGSCYHGSNPCGATNLMSGSV